MTGTAAENRAGMSTFSAALWPFESRERALQCALALQAKATQRRVRYIPRKAHYYRVNKSRERTEEDAGLGWPKSHQVQLTWRRESRCGASFSLRLLFSRTSQPTDSALEDFPSEIFNIIYFLLYGMAKTV